MLSSVVKYGVLILISMSVCIYAEQSCISHVCNEICSMMRPNNIIQCSRNCDTRCSEFDNSNNTVCDSDIDIRCKVVHAYCRQCEFTPETSTTAPTTVDDNGDNRTAVKAAIGSVVSVIILIGVAIMIWYFMNKKSRKGTKPQSVSYTMDNISYGTADEIHSKNISENNHVDIDVHDDSQYNTLHDTTTETHEYAYAGYPGVSEHQSKPTVYAEVSNDSPEYYVLQKEQESDVSELVSGIKVKPTDTDTLKQNESQSGYMCLQHDGSTTVNIPPLASQSEADTEYDYASYPQDCRDQSKPTACAKVLNDLPVYYTLQKEQESDVTELTSDVKVKTKDIDILKQNGSQSEYMCLQHDASTTRNAPPHVSQGDVDTCASYPEESRDGIEPTGCAKVSKDLPVSYTLQKEQESDVTELTSNAEVKTKDIDTLKENGSHSEYMCLQHDASTATNTPPPATQSETDAEYTYASYPEDYRDQSKPTRYAKVSNDLPEYYTPKKEQISDVTRLNIASLQNDDAYDELRCDGNDSNEGAYNTLNRLACINVPDDVTDDYNQLIPTPAFDEESEEYSHLNRTSIETDESVTDHGYGKLELPTKPTAGSIKSAANNSYEETLPNLPDDDTRDVNSQIS